MTFEYYNKTPITVSCAQNVWSKIENGTTNLWTEEDTVCYVVRSWVRGW